MSGEITTIQGGSITSPKGFSAGATFAGLRTYAEDKLDLGILISEEPCNVAGVFTTNSLKSASVTLTQEHLLRGETKALVVNSGIANACVGDQGYLDAQATARHTANHLGIMEHQVLVCSTGVIGVELPMSLVSNGIGRIQVSDQGGNFLARAILTTDSHPKETAVGIKIGQKTVTIGGIAKGAGMIHPNMATLLSFIATDANISKQLLDDMLKESANSSFNMISIDGDTSTNDSVIVFANGASGADNIESGSDEAHLFLEALRWVCTHLAKEIVKDGEGASKLIEVTVEKAKDLDDARVAARNIARSSLVKTAVHGNDPNWGRIIAALGSSGAEVEEKKIDLYVNEVCIMEAGKPVPFHKDSIIAIMSGEEVSFRVCLNLGEAMATAWGCDLSEEYVTFNSSYST